MLNRLTSSWSDIRDKPIAPLWISQTQVAGDMRRGGEELAKQPTILRCQISHRGDMTSRNKEHMLGSLRIDIRERHYILVLVNEGAWNAPIGDFTEQAIFHIQLSLPSAYSAVFSLSLVAVMTCTFCVSGFVSPETVAVCALCVSPPVACSVAGVAPGSLAWAALAASLASLASRALRRISSNSAACSSGSLYGGKFISVRMALIAW